MIFGSGTYPYLIFWPIIWFDFVYVDVRTYEYFVFVTGCNCFYFHFSGLPVVRCWTKMSQNTLAVISTLRIPSNEEKLIPTYEKEQWKNSKSVPFYFCNVMFLKRIIWYLILGLFTTIYFWCNGLVCFFVFLVSCNIILVQANNLYPRMIVDYLNILYGELNLMQRAVRF